MTPGRVPAWSASCLCCPHQSTRRITIIEDDTTRIVTLKAGAAQALVASRVRDISPAGAATAGASGIAAVGAAAPLAAGCAAKEDAAAAGCVDVLKAAAFATPALPAPSVIPAAAAGRTLLRPVLYNAAGAAAADRGACCLGAAAGAAAADAGTLPAKVPAPGTHEAGAPFAGGDGVLRLAEAAAAADRSRALLRCGCGRLLRISGRAVAVAGADAGAVLVAAEAGAAGAGAALAGDPAAGAASR